jgi:hypothetical protein
MAASAIKGSLHTEEVYPAEPSGTYLVSTTVGETVRAFMPDPLPPNPPLKLDTLLPLLDRAKSGIRQIGWPCHPLA